VGFVFPLLWLVAVGMVLDRRVRLNGIVDTKVYWTQVQWLKLNYKYGLWSGIGFIAEVLLVTVIVMVVKAYARK
jgi:hypothetical protein